MSEEINTILDKLIDYAKQKYGNGECVLEYDGEWTIRIVNTSNIFNIGETGGRFIGCGETIQDAVSDVIRDMEE